MAHLRADKENQTMQVHKKFILGLCTSFALVSAMVLIVVFTNATPAVASFAKSSATPTPCTTAESSACASVVDITPSAGGSLSQYVSIVRVPTTIVPGDETIPFSFTVHVADTRDATSAWELSASAPAISFNVISDGAVTSTSSDVMLNSIKGFCDTAAACTFNNGSSTPKETLANGPIDISDTSPSTVISPTLSNSGMTILGAVSFNITGSIALPADLLGGSYNTTVTLTLAPDI